jgi:hypothetical protein
VGSRRSDEADVERVRQDDVVDVPALAPQQSWVLDPADPLSEQTGH